MRDGLEVARTATCTVECTVNDTGVFGGSYSYTLRTFFPDGLYIGPSLTPAFTFAIPHRITVPSTTYMLPRGGRADVPITNTANPDGSLGGLVSGSGNGIQVNDPGRNTLVVLVSTGAPYGYQEVKVTGPSQASAILRAAVMRTPGQLLLTMPGVTSRTAASSTSRLRVAQLDAVRWSDGIHARAGHGGRRILRQQRRARHRRVRRWTAVWRPKPLGCQAA
jgi:hypothetical protein